MSVGVRGVWMLVWRICWVVVIRRGEDVDVGVSADVGVERVLGCECGCAGVGVDVGVEMLLGCGMKLRNFGTSWVWVFVCSGMELALK